MYVCMTQIHRSFALVRVLYSYDLSNRAWWYNEIPFHREGVSDRRSRRCAERMNDARMCGRQSPDDRSI
jgi:hypothetical protein